MYIPNLRNYHDKVFPYGPSSNGYNPVIRLTDRTTQPDPSQHIYQEEKISKCEGLSYRAREWLLLSSNSNARVAIALAEPVLYLPGATSSEIQSEHSAVLRGSLCIQIYKPVKLKKIQLSFKGKSRTEWPEGIPPKLFDTYEENSIMNHCWVFFHSEQKVDENSHGAVWYKVLPHYADTAHYPRSMECFYPGEYVYNFELPISCTYPESIQTDMGRVYYFLETLVDRSSTFSGKSTGRIPIELIRSPCSTSVATSEPILVSKSWEDRLHYEVQVGEKCVVMGQVVPVNFKFTLLGEVKFHKLRLFLMERRYYYCRQRSVRRKEKTRQLLLYERSAPKNQCLLSDWKQVRPDVYELSDQVRIPGCHDMAANIVHFDTTYPNIKITHTVRTVLRFSCENSPELMGSAKYLEIYIDSPVRLLSCRCSDGSTMLPAYCPIIPSSEVNFCSIDNRIIAGMNRDLALDSDIIGNSPPSFDSWTAVPYQAPPPKYDDIFQSGSSHDENHDDN
ncbi:Arrestin Aly1 [Schizosaccharomyces pombe]|uniref:Putative arrestin-related trafficking adapter aly1 n=1 Tax=Schizosaccharomyces pombe (strain 972 / ATCC 24843) TaxID=284812 RepID=ALY1_SCHPO|nr:RecName: Full=Putative arrestin-related trafficking adapter SPBC839.02 [Schizosaccharomyces pombe 972h-]